MVGRICEVPRNVLLYIEQVGGVGFHEGYKKKGGKNDLESALHYKST